MPESFGTLPGGQPVVRHTLDRGGLRLRVLSYGALVQSLELDGVNVALGFDNLGDYVERNSPGPYLGATIGRFANRIADGRFTLDGRKHRLDRNDGPNALHGGADGFDRRLWTVVERTEHAVRLRHTSPDGEEGYPGTLTVEVLYELQPGGVVGIAYHAVTDKPTVVNLTNHTSFNLAGEGSGTVDGHELEVRASRYLPVDLTAIPAGGPAPVTGTPLDFTRPAAIGPRIRTHHAQLAIGQGIDHAYVLDHDEGLGLAVRLSDPASGRTLEVRTTEPGLQVYTGNFLDGSLVGSGGRTYRQGDGIALETQHHPDSPNRPDFPSTVLRPGEAFASRTEWRLIDRPR
jgi:aldose 1-epimerase